MSIDKTRIWGLEQDFWTSEEEFFDQNLTADASVLFPEQVGLLDRKATIESLSEGPRWSEVDLQDRNEIQLGAEITLIAYRALARMTGEEEAYRANGLSIYRREGEKWKLAFHFQIPAAG